MDTNSERRKRKKVVVVVVVIVVIIMGVLFLTPRTKARIESVDCANILSWLGVAAKTYALDYKETYAPDISSMSNELSTPKILLCPSDRSKTAAPNFSALTPSNISYEYLMPGVKGGLPRRAIFRCPIHGHVVCEDGSVVLKTGTVLHGKVLPRPKSFLKARAAGGASLHADRTIIGPGLGQCAVAPTMGGVLDVGDVFGEGLVGQGRDVHFLRANVAANVIRFHRT